MFIPVLNVISPENIIIWLTDALARRYTSVGGDAKSSVHSESTAACDQQQLTQEDCLYKKSEINTICAGCCPAGFCSNDAWAHFAGALDAAAAEAHLRKEGQYLWRVEPGAFASRAVDEPAEFVLSYAVSDDCEVCHVIFFGFPFYNDCAGGFDYVRFGGGSRDPRLVDRKRELASIGLVPSLREVVRAHFADIAFLGICFTNMCADPLSAPPCDNAFIEEPMPVLPTRTPMPHVSADARVQCG